MGRGPERKANSERHVGELPFETRRPSWHQAFRIPFLTVPGLLGGERANSAAKPWPGVAHTQEEEKTSTLRTGGGGEPGPETQPASQVGGAVQPRSKELSNLLRGTGLGCLSLALISSSAFTTQENIGANFRLAWGEGCRGPQQ